MSTVFEERPRAETLHAVEAELNYLRAGEGRPVSYTFEPPPGVPWTSGALEPRRVTIRDARPLAAAGELSLDKSGFERIAHASALTDFSDDAAIRSIYYNESAQVLIKATGAEKVVVFDHTLRDSLNGSRATSSLREPVRRVHNDQTFVSGPRRVRDHLTADEAAQRLKHRFAIINLWRPLDVVEQLPSPSATHARSRRAIWCQAILCTRTRSARPFPSRITRRIAGITSRSYGPTKRCCSRSTTLATTARPV